MIQMHRKRGISAREGASSVAAGAAGGSVRLTTTVTFNEAANALPNNRFVHVTTVVQGKDSIA